MKIDEAITRYKNNAEYERTHGNLQGFLEFKQLYKWLKELRAYRKMYHKEHEDDCLKAESEGRVDILDKIRAEIDNALSDGMIHKKTVLGIIDKYKEESEGEEPEI